MLTADVQRERVNVLGARLTEIGEMFVTGVDWLADQAAELAQTDNEYRAALAACGDHDRRPLARELATEVLHGRLGALRPYVPFLTPEAADRAAEALTAPYPPEED